MGAKGKGSRVSQWRIQDKRVPLGEDLERLEIGYSVGALYSELSSESERVEKKKTVANPHGNILCFPLSKKVSLNIVQRKKYDPVVELMTNAHPLFIK